MKLKLYNTRTRRKEIFRPIDGKAVRMYVCGPTVYDFAHIGNARPVIVFDVLFRLLRHFYGAEHVIYARNITDVDDKINARAAAEGISIRELTEHTAAQFHADVAAIGALPPTIEPRATEHIAEMIALVERLVERGHAYAAEGHVLFNVPSDDDYGELSRRSVDDMRAGARVEVAPYKRDAMDFVLWKPSTGAEPGWESPWGFGRPGWHLECSAMAEKHLGTVFDIHGGGIDLLFPHHENELAQSTCAHDTEVMANYWVHNGHLQVEGQKMSKSLGNFITIRDLLKDWPGDVIRLNMLRTHYRQPMDWTAKGLAESDSLLRRWRAAIDEDGVVSDGDFDDSAFLDALADDLNTPLAISAIHQMEPGDKFRALDLLGLGEPAEDPRLKAVNENAIEARITARLAARKSKDWAEADRIRNELAAMGVALKDAKNPATGEIETTWEIAR
ncbi:cysteine--tRNA ligase [Rhodomicrobium sp.]|uniref:cysteine--tRNA ligase n=1 Tax=Rhodomicrobium sp. TaxID=2720632 RepID=UPI0039E410A7